MRNDYRGRDYDRGDRYERRNARPYDDGYYEDDYYPDYMPPEYRGGRMIGYGERERRNGNNMRYIRSGGRAYTSRMDRGYAGGEMDDMYAWADEMKNADGSRGAHWTLEQVKKLMQQRGITRHPAEDVWLAMNAEYSDRCVVNKKYGLVSPDFYLDSAIAFWLEDEDASEDKLGTYYDCIVKH